jgi:hypothetical protein
MSLIPLLAPILLELIKIFFGGGSSTEKEKAAAEITATLRRVRAALAKAKDTDDTSDLEKEINKH